jgi:alkanesulfonate monooxygenase SsuD/methylene tetrahydromethanopterin reductase-like flavin-dependent oxidoreductase (luciferase family)
MKFGLFYEWPNPDARDWRTLFEEGIEQIQYSEELGFDFVLIAEHHFSNYGMSPSPLLQALSVAQRTTRLKIATAVLVLPEWQPLRLAEEVAVLDQLSNGRFICGVGRGYQPHEFARFGVTAEQSRGIFNESLDVLLKAWTSSESFTYHGDHITIPHEVVVWPKPLQQPHPPLWVAGSSADTMRLAAERDLVPITTGFLGWEGIADAAALWVQTRRELGKLVEDFELGLQTMTLITENDERARACLAYPRWQLRAARSLNRSDVVNGCVTPTSYEGEPDEDGLWNSLYYGSPDTVIAKFRRAAEAGVTFASNWMMMGGIDHDTVMNSIKLMGQEVLPALRDEHPPADLVERLASRPLTSTTLRRTVGPAGSAATAPT